MVSGIGLGLFVLVCGAILAGWLGPSTYHAEFVPHLQSLGGDAGLYQVARGDFDGDGELELAVGQPLGVVGLDLEGGQPVPLFQANLPQRFVRDGALPQLGAAGDINGDGTDEVFVTVATAGGADHGRWYLLGYDPVAAAWSWSYALPAGEDTNGDGKWSDVCRPVGFLATDSLCTRPAVLVARSVGYDRYGRGLLAIDPVGGDEVWRYAMGTNPVPTSVWTGDVDGDALAEIVLAGHAPGNLHGEKINGTSDDRPWLFVLDTAGRLQWRQALGGTFCAPRCDVSDLDGDGAVEIVTWTINGRPDQLSVWRAANGDLLARQSRAEAFWGGGLLPAEGDEPAVVVVGSPLAGLQRYVFDGFNLERAGSCWRGPATVLCTGDAVPGPGPELLATTGAGQAVLLDRDLRELASRDCGASTGHNVPGVIWQTGPGQGLSVFPVREGRRGLAYLEAGTAWWRSPVAAGLVAAALACALLLEWRWRRRPVPAASSPDREKLVRLLRELDESSHGTLSATRGLSRLVWLLRTHVKQQGSQAGAHERLQIRLADFRETVRPRLHQILDLAEASDFETLRAAGTRGALDRAERDLDRSAAGDFAVAEVEAGLARFGRHVDDVERGFRALRGAVRDHFTVDLERVLLRLLALYEDRFRTGSIAVDFQAPRGEESAGAIIDAGDVRFVLENLLDNAVRALAGIADPCLQVGLFHEGASAVVTIGDNGAGIPAKHRERIFSPSFSSRRGGGLGLARSRELLQKWNGQLTLETSRQGWGSVFRLVIPLAQARTARAVT